MSENIRRTIQPQQYIRHLFAATEEGRMPITYYPDLEPPTTLTYNVSWTAADAEAVVQRYTEIEAALRHIAAQHDGLEEPAQRMRLLTEEEQRIWEIFVRPFEDFDTRGFDLAELFDRMECGDELTEEENDLMDDYYTWRCDQCRRRLPRRYSDPDRLVMHGKRLERLLYWHAPAVVINEEACYLAEQLVLYYGEKAEEA